MTFFDITVPLSTQTIPWEKDAHFKLKWVSRTKASDPSSYNLSKLAMSSHLGTHVDAPLHFVHEGSDVASMDLLTLCGPARVVDMRGKGPAIGPGELAGKIEGATRILLKTDNGELLAKKRFTKDFAHLTGDGAKHLRDGGVLLVGIDYLSIDAWTDPDRGILVPAHHALLDPRGDGAPPVVILETIDLRDVEQGEYELICLPLKIVGGDGAPARAVLVR